VPIGNDFEFMNPEFAQLQFENYQKLFDHMNGDRAMNVHARFATLGEYFADLRQTVAVEKPPAQALPVLQGSFFTYADKEDEYWSGYYSSRPFVKHQARGLEATIHAAATLHQFLRQAAGAAGAAVDAQLTTARKMLSIFQHHDAITGTGNAKTVRDYSAKLHTGLSAAEQRLSKDVGATVGALGELQLLWQRAGARGLPEREPVALGSAKAVGVVLYNPSGFARPGLARLLLDTDDVCVDGAAAAQVGKAFELHAGKLSASKSFELAAMAQLPPFGLAVLIVRPGGGCVPPAKVGFYGKGVGGAELPGPEIKLSTPAMDVRFDSRSGALTGIDIDVQAASKLAVRVGDEFTEYQGAAKHSGAYLFRPTGKAQPHGGEAMVSVGLGRIVTLTTVHPPYTRFANIFSASLSETTMRLNPRWAPLSDRCSRSCTRSTRPPSAASRRSPQRTAPAAVPCDSITSSTSRATAGATRSLVCASARPLRPRVSSTLI
jgi:alpha-mannosidase II